MGVTRKVTLRAALTGSKLGEKEVTHVTPEIWESPVTMGADDAFGATPMISWKSLSIVRLNACGWLWMVYLHLSTIMRFFSQWRSMGNSYHGFV